MSRLTFRDSKGELWIKDAADIDEQGQICMLTDRLAAYEDIGLEPKQVRKIANVLQEVGQEYNCRFEFVAEVVEKCAKYVKAERDGRLVVLPCKVGDTVYKIAQGMSLYKPGLIPYVVEVEPKSLSEICQWVEDGYYLGKTVFLTRAEAEEAMKGGTA
jgi:hypothetical protein